MDTATTDSTAPRISSLQSSLADWSTLPHRDVRIAVKLWATVDALACSRPIPDPSCSQNLSADGFADADPSLRDLLYRSIELLSLLATPPAIGGHSTGRAAIT